MAMRRRGLGFVVLVLEISALCVSGLRAQSVTVHGWGRWRWGAAGLWALDSGHVFSGEKAHNGAGALGIRTEIGPGQVWRFEGSAGVALDARWRVLSGVRWGPSRVVVWRLGLAQSDRGWCRVDFPWVQPAGAPLVSAWQAGFQEQVAPGVWCQAVLDWAQGSRPQLRLTVQQDRTQVGAGSGGVFLAHALDGGRVEVTVAIGWMRRQLPWGGASAGRLHPWWGGGDPLVSHWMNPQAR